MDMEAMAAEVARRRDERLAAARDVLERLRAIPSGVLAEWLVLHYRDIFTPIELADLEEHAAWAEEERAYAAWRAAHAALQQAREAIAVVEPGKAYLRALGALETATDRERRAWRKYHRLFERNARRGA